MDPVRAERMSKELVGTEVGGWSIKRYLGAGKSAVVFEGEKSGEQAALKIFDPELVDRFGKATQLARIDREKNLIGKRHPCLVEIYDGGECSITGYLYVAMEFIDAPNLGDSLTLIPREKIAYILSQVASAARFLEEKELAHRDIKPENIAVFPDFSRAVLLDLGVLRPFGDPGLTDEDQRVFVGTLRYSSPEFLLRKESDTPEGWRAITFYQLGAVLHDMITRKPLFKEFSEPFAVLVEAVKSERAEIHADDVSADLVLLAHNCLVKPPEARLKLVSWEDFQLPSAVRRPVESARDRVKKRSLLTRSQATEIVPTLHPDRGYSTKVILGHIDTIIRNECTGSDSLPPIEIMEDSSQCRILVIFAPSPEQELASQLCIIFDCDLIDEGTMALNINVSACLAASGGIPDEPSNPFELFRGPLQSTLLTTKVQDVLWCSVDLAQRQGKNPAGGAMWLELADMMEG